MLSSDISFYLYIALFWSQLQGKQNRSTLRRRMCKTCHTQTSHLIMTSWILARPGPLFSPPTSPCSSPPITPMCMNSCALMWICLFWRNQAYEITLLRKSYCYSPKWKELCTKPFDSTKYAEALSKAIGQPHVTPDVPYIWAIVHTAGSI